ncbi:hypothetical protein [Bdellovibrio sp. HCB337]|uniref:phage head spike fiber domain-containing protein n=1 Tax=Bdellovibrio sp. HCB337 TaxID=3394358 RepID=UPI0039A4543A
MINKKKLGTLTVLILFSVVARTSYSHVIPFAFLRAKAPTLNWDFTALTSLPSQLTFTRASTATYINSSGLIQTAAINTPRFSYDPTTLQPEGLLMEASATNMISCSENIDKTTCWDANTTAMAVNHNVAVAPDGATTAEKITATGDAWLIAPVPTTSIGTPYTFSIYAKGDTSGHATLYLQEAGGAYTWFGQLDMLITTSWQRYTVTGTKTNSNPMRAVVALYQSGGDMGSIYIWGAQYEAGSLATSYIPTTTVAVTRSADSATFNTMTWFNATNGTLFAEYKNIGVEAATTYRVFGLFNTNVAGTFAQNSIEISDSNTTVRSGVTTASSAVFAPSATLSAAGVINRQAITYKANSFTSSINRAAVGSDTSGTLPAPAYGYLGSQPDGNIRNRYIRRIHYYDTNVTNAQLQGL